MLELSQLESAEFLKADVILRKMSNYSNSEFQSYFSKDLDDENTLIQDRFSNFQVKLEFKQIIMEGTLEEIRQLFEDELHNLSTTFPEIQVQLEMFRMEQDIKDHGPLSVAKKFKELHSGNAKREVIVYQDQTMSYIPICQLVRLIVVSKHSDLEKHFEEVGLRIGLWEKVNSCILSTLSVT